MLFFEDSLKLVKRELKDAGADLSYIKEWQKPFEKVKKQYMVLKEEYAQARMELDQVYQCLKTMEQLLITGKAALSKDLSKQLHGYAKQLKSYQNSFNQEFLISKADKDFHLTYGTLLNLCNKPLKEEKQVLILQSEVENLLAMTKEALEKQWPDLRALAFFYLGHTDTELVDLPHSEKVSLVNRLYETEFMQGIRVSLKESLGEKRAMQILEDEVWN